MVDDNINMYIKYENDKEEEEEDNDERARDSLRQIVDSLRQAQVADSVRQVEDGVRQVADGFGKDTDDTQQEKRAGKDEKREKNDIAMNGWRSEHENIFVEWCDKAMSFRWLHRRCHKYYTWYNAGFTIPVIILSTITGTANFATEYFSDDARRYVPLVIGSINILTGIVGTVHQFLKISEINEAHRVSYIAWDKFYRNIKLELCKKPDERIGVADMLRYSKEEYDRLIETSPSIHENVIREFKSQFKKDDFIIPEMCDNLRSSRESMYKEKTSEQKPIVSNIPIPNDDKMLQI